MESAALHFYEQVRQNNWPQAEPPLQQIAKLAEPVIVRFDATSAPLANAVVKSARAFQHRDREAALHAANKVIEWVATAKRGAQANAPPEIVRLGFLARELQIETGAGNDEKLAARTAAVRRCWDRLKAWLETSGDPSLALAGEAVVRRLELPPTSEAAGQAQAALLAFIEEVTRHFDQGDL